MRMSSAASTSTPDPQPPALEQGPLAGQPCLPVERFTPCQLKLHRDVVVADTHNELPTLVVRRPRSEWAVYFRDRWLPQLRAGGVDVLPVYIS